MSKIKLNFGAAYGQAKRQEAIHTAATPEHSAGADAMLPELPRIREPEIAVVEEIAAIEGEEEAEVAQAEEHLDIPQSLANPLRDDEIAQGGVDAHPSAKHASSPRAKRPTATVKMVPNGEAKAGARSRKSAHIAPDGSGEVRVAVMLPDTMAEWIHRQSFSRGMGVRGKSAIVREAVDGWLADLDAMPAATRKETLRSLKSTNATEGELKCYMFGLSTQALARLDEYASDWSLRLPVALMMRVSVDRRMRVSV
jgi:hypothetical protein